MYGGEERWRLDSSLMWEAFRLWARLTHKYAQMAMNNNPSRPTIVPTSMELLKGGPFDDAVVLPPGLEGLLAKDDDKAVSPLFC